MTLKPITFAALLAVPIAGAAAQAPQASDHGSDGHRGWFLKAAGALTSAAVFSSMIHSDEPGNSAFGHAQRELHLPSTGGALNGPGNSNNTPNITHPDHPDHPDTPVGTVNDGGDDVTTTPEPGTAALLATGLVGLGGMVRRRSRG